MNEKTQTTGIRRFSTKKKITLAVTVFVFALFAISSFVPSMNFALNSSAYVFANKPISGGFLNGAIGTATYFKTQNCDPPASKLLDVSPSVNNFVAGCEVGAMGDFNSNAAALWILVPAYAGLSIFGVKSLGASSNGFPTFQGKTVETDCGAGGTATSCPDHPTYLYSPAFTAVEKYLGINNGVFGLAEGVLPTPSHTHIIYTASLSAWYIVTVLVFDPNILPNPATGQCSNVVSSSLSNPQANCLTSLSALKAAMTTQSATAVSNANAKNPIWLALGKPTTQVVIPGDTTVSTIGNENTNIVLFFNVSPNNPYQTNDVTGD